MKSSIAWPLTGLKISQTYSKMNVHICAVNFNTYLCVKYNYHLWEVVITCTCHTPSGLPSPTRH